MTEAEALPVEANAFDFFPTFLKKSNHPWLREELEGGPILLLLLPDTTDETGRGLKSSTMLPSGMVSISAASWAMALFDL